LKGLADPVGFTAPRKIKINRILIKAEIRKCFAGTDWESQDLDTICKRISDKLDVYGDVDEDVIGKVRDQVRTKLKDKGRDPDAAPPQKEEVNLYGVDAVKNNETVEVNLYSNEVSSNNILTFPPPPPPRVMSPQDVIAQAQVPEVESDSEEEDLYGLNKSPAPHAAMERIGFDWSLEKLQRTIQMQFAGATSWRTVINAVQKEDADFSSKIAQDLYERISAESKPFSHEEVGNMALSSLDKMYIKFNENRKRDPVTKNVEISQPEGQIAMDQDSGDGQLIGRLRSENQNLRADLDRERQEKRVLLGELDKLRGTLSTVEANNKQLADMLQSKQREVSDGKRLVSEMSSANVKVNDESMAVRAQMEEIRQFAIRSQKAARDHSGSVVVPKQVVEPKPKVPAPVNVSQPRVSQHEGRPAPVVEAVKAVPVVPVKAISSHKSMRRVDTTIPEELHSLHFPDPISVSPWQSTTSYAKTKNGTTKAIITWTIIDFRDCRHVVTLEHNHYTFRGKSKRKIFIDNQVQISEKTGTLNYRFNLDNDSVTLLLIKGENGFQYELMVNDLSFEASRKHYIEIQQAIRASMAAERRG